MRAAKPTALRAFGPLFPETQKIASHYPRSMRSPTILTCSSHPRCNGIEIPDKTASVATVVPNRSQTSMTKKRAIKKSATKTRTESYAHTNRLRVNNQIGFATPKTALVESQWQTFSPLLHERPDQSSNIPVWDTNEHLGFENLYIYREAVRKYRRNYLIRLSDGTTPDLEVASEVTSQVTGESKARHKHPKEWAQSVSTQGAFGDRRLAVSHYHSALPDAFQQHTWSFHCI
jgi:hypothetical protein